MLERDDIARLIPHQGEMVLLDRITEWTMSHIVCTTRTHLRPDNPLRRAEGLATVCGVEYGAQAMAAHGTLVDARKNRPGYLASLRDIEITAPWLHDIDQELTVRADLVIQDSGTAIYDFSISAAGKSLLRGQAGVFMK